MSCMKSRCHCKRVSTCMRRCYQKVGKSSTHCCKKAGEGHTQALLITMTAVTQGYPVHLGGSRPLGSRRETTKGACFQLNKTCWCQGHFNGHCRV
jgi:hypothetical protein